MVDSRRGAPTEPKAPVCVKCGLPLKIGQAKFAYLGHEMISEAPMCPKCGQVYLTEEFVNERVRAIEGSLEDK